MAGGWCGGEERSETHDAGQAADVLDFRVEEEG